MTATVPVGPYSYIRRRTHESGVIIEQVIQVPPHTRKRPVRRRPDNQPRLEGFDLAEAQLTIYDVPGVYDVPVGSVHSAGPAGA